jgi:hypothetical protein
MQPNELARAAYAAYGEVTGHKNFRGDPMPDFDDLGDTIQRAWVGAATTVRRLAVRGFASDLHELSPAEQYDEIVKQAAGF